MERITRQLFMLSLFKNTMWHLFKYFVLISHPLVVLCAADNDIWHHFILQTNSCTNMHSYPTTNDYLSWMLLSTSGTREYFHIPRLLRHTLNECIGQLWAGAPYTYNRFNSTITKCTCATKYYNSHPLSASNRVICLSKSV